MPSPFPGMNPYLERRSVWHDFHGAFIHACRESLVSQVPAEFVVRIDDHIYVHELAAEDRRLVGRADIGISSFAEAEGGLAVVDIIAAPAQVQLPEIDEERVSYIEIRDRESWSVVTVLELLSPANKYQGRDRDTYCKKREQILRSPVHLVEIDLLRGGPRLPFVEVPTCEYCVMVSRVQRRPHADFWPLRLREPLPIVPVPLSEGHADVRLDLQAPLHRVYDGARYGNYIYRGEPEPQLSDADREWVTATIEMKTA